MQRDTEREHTVLSEHMVFEKNNGNVVSNPQNFSIWHVSRGPFMFPNDMTNKSLFERKPKNGLRCEDSCTPFTSERNAIFTKRLISTRAAKRSSFRVNVLVASPHLSLPFIRAFISANFTSAVWSRLCVSVSQRASQWMLYTDTCLYVLITDVCFSSSPDSSGPPMALSLSPCPHWAQHRWHKAAWLACHTSIRQRGAAGERKLS